MTTISAGSSATVSLSAGQRVVISGQGTAQVQPLSNAGKAYPSQPIAVPSTTLGAFKEALNVFIVATTDVAYTVYSPGDVTAEDGSVAFTAAEVVSVKAGGATDDYYDANGTTYTLSTSELAVKFTNGSGCAVTIPTGIASGTTWPLVKDPAGGTVSIDRSASAGVTIYPTGTLQIANNGDVMCVTSLGGNVAVVTGYNQSGPRFLGYFADWPAVVADYPVSGAAIAALNHGDFLVGTGTTIGGLDLVPNKAKTRMVSSSRRITLIELGGTLANPVVAAITATGIVTVSGGLPQLPAYLAQPGDRIEVMGLARHTAGGTPSGTELQLKLGTANSASDQTIAKITTSSTNNQDGGAFQFAWVYDTSTVGAWQSTIPNSSSTSVQNTPSPLAFNSLQYFNLNMATLASGDTFILTQLVVTLVQKQ